jgi:type IV pilus assembly protein PilE
MKIITKYFRHHETGFTMIELLITIAVLGIITAIIIPNVSGFIRSSHVASANSELTAAQTAAQAYYAEHVASTISFTSADLVPYLSTAAKYGTYTFAYNAILLSAAPVNPGGDISWDTSAGIWAKK